MGECLHETTEVVRTELGAFFICRACGHRFIDKKRRLVNLWIAQRFYQYRGAIYSSQLSSLLASVTSGGVIFLVINMVWEVTPTLWILPAIWVVKLIVETTLGYIDFKKWKVAQTERLFGFRYAPLEVEQLRRLMNIEKVVNPSEYKAESIVDSVGDLNGKMDGK